MSLYSAKISDVAKLVENQVPDVVEKTPEVDEAKDESDEAIDDEETLPETKLPAPKKVILEKTKRIRRDPEQPPKWFMKFHENIDRERSVVNQDRKPVKRIKKESKERAEENWQRPQVRERVQTEVDNHMGKMYGMIFSNRKM